MTRPIYLDYQATTPLAPEAHEAMLPYLGEKFGNPHSPHRMGREAAAAVEVAREQVMACLGATTGTLAFTSGATEAANWAITGILPALRQDRWRIVTFATEHACVLDTAKYCARNSFDLAVLGVGADGLIDLDKAREAIVDDVLLVAATLVNNEIGVIQPVAEVAAMARSAGAAMFCDAVQAFGRIVIPWEACDMIALSAHKIHGPKGIGALWLADGARPEPLLHGGGQEAGGRSGTLAPALCAGFGAAASLANERREIDLAHVERLSFGARKGFADWTVNGSVTARYPGNLNIRRDGVDAARLISEVREVAFSAGSACASGSGRPSHVLAAIGLSDAEARSSIRLGFGRYTTAEEIDRAVTLIVAAADRQLSLAA